MAAMCLDSVIRVLEAEKLALLYTLSGFMCRGPNACLKCAWSPDGTQFTCSTSTKVQILKQKAGRAVCGVRQRGWTVGRVAGAREREKVQYRVSSERESAVGERERVQYRVAGPLPLRRIKPHQPIKRDLCAHTSETSATPVKPLSR